MKMINVKLLRKIQEKHPEYSIHQLRSVINYHWEIFNRKLSKAQTVDLTINNIGTIHTHRNVINIAKANSLQALRKKDKIKLRYSDKNLLF
ncbi:hypothetical protein [uncultured Clostridium sp.]|uniref:hypothetical protein n=1 Tax=uncultured Clostridium sp. TaxID=59620 RepID=UPI00261D6894|nr:hypothetical protein [uncultured Clostridium sp.]